MYDINPTRQIDSLFFFAAFSHNNTMASTVASAVASPPPSPLRGLYGGGWHAVVACGDAVAGVAVPECVVSTTPSQTRRYMVFKLSEKPPPEDIFAVEEKVFTTPSFTCGRKPIAPYSVRVWSDERRSFVQTTRLSEAQVRGITVAGPLPSLRQAAERMVSYLVQEKEKKTVQCMNCGCVRHMGVDLSEKTAAEHGVITWTRAERKRFIEAQRALGYTGFSTWEEDNYLVRSRSWFKDYIAWGKQCPVCAGKKQTQRPALMVHVCAGCRRSMQTCIGKPCAWQRTKIRFWKEENHI